MTQVVIYTRYSPRREAEKSTSCETQEAICRAHAEAQGWEVRSVHHDEGVSGKAWPREALEGALLELRRGDVLLVWRRCRIAREVLIAELVQRHVRSKKARTVAVEGDVAGLEDESPEAVFVRQILAAVAELERKQIGARTKAAMKARQRAGQRMGRYAPYGFRVDPKDKTRLLPVPAEAAAAERARELIAEGLSPWKAARKLDEELPDACRGAKWNAATVKKIAGRAP